MGQTNSRRPAVLSSDRSTLITVVFGFMTVTAALVLSGCAYHMPDFDNPLDPFGTASYFVMEGTILGESVSIDTAEPEAYIQGGQSNGEGGRVYRILEPTSDGSLATGIDIGVDSVYEEGQTFDVQADNLEIVVLSSIIDEQHGGWGVWVDSGTITFDLWDGTIMVGSYTLIASDINLAGEFMVRFR